MVCPIGRLLESYRAFNSKHFDTYTYKKCRHSNYCYANGPKVKIAVSPNDMPPSHQRTDIIWALLNFLFWDFCITIVTAFTF